ncbi:MAG: glycosyltransferase family 4 protein, partial [Thermomicrobiales bacterium]|nr:glycosyltransferase family 4 protein [Thermomicrobiales bacterium]
MRIAIDQSAGFNQGAGIGRYARNLVPALVDRMPNARFTLWYAPENGARFLDEAIDPFTDTMDVRVRRTRCPRRRMDQLWFRLRAPWPIELWTGRQDLVYSPDFTAPPSMRAPRIVTVHDLAFQIVPERAPEGLRRYLSAAVPRAVGEAAAVVAVSETTRHDVIDRLGVAPERISVVPNAADGRFFTAAPLDEAQRRRLGLPEQYLLTVGTLEPRKNHLTLFRALDMLPAGSRLPLVVVGRVGWSAGEIVAEARARQEQGTVILLDYLADDFLPGLYAGAAALIYPSWYEGFGLPVLEGLATGVTVVASDVPAHREVAGEQAIYAPPGSP